MRTAPQDFDKAKNTLAEDLIAIFHLYQHKAVKLLDKAIEEGWSPEKVIEEVANLDKQKAGRQ